MACCHTLTQLNNDTLIGNLVDKVMFQATGAKIYLLKAESPDALQMSVTMTSGEVVKILKQFDFDHQR